MNERQPVRRGGQVGGGEAQQSGKHSIKRWSSFPTVRTKCHEYLPVWLVTQRQQHQNGSKKSGYVGFHCYTWIPYCDAHHSRDYATCAFIVSAYVMGQAVKTSV
ncbi:hypothetical protein E2C01_089765 [Portunus trituberculatus]|uniref:Uncharacterized protein n=1 Tax=Portunus trituberculatus TaxID=210409 RepID=A0A5B7JCX2_PORTR|nr:hypothetical protein [Portunus trituberculatus]